MKKQLLAGVLSATMVMASMSTTAIAVDATEEATNLLLGSTISSEQEIPENESGGGSLLRLNAYRRLRFKRLQRQRRRRMVLLSPFLNPNALLQSVTSITKH